MRLVQYAQRLLIRLNPFNQLNGTEVIVRVAPCRPAFINVFSQLQGVHCNE